MTLPDDMLALVQTQSGYSGRAEGPAIETLEPFLEARRIPLPQPKDGQVLIRVAMASVNPSDLHFIKGEYGQPRVQDAPAGFEAVGEVVAGAGVKAESLMGKRVAFVAGRGGSGTWADYALTAAAGCIPVRADMRDEDAAGHIVNPLTALAMFDIARRTGATSFILTAAASQLGKLMTGLGRDHDIAPIAIVRRAEQIETLKALGCRHVLDENAADFNASLKQVIAKEKPPLMFDAVAGQVAADIFAAMPVGARWIVYGKLDPVPPRLTEMGQFVFMDKKVEGFWLSRWFAATPLDLQMAAIAEVQERFVSGKWRTEIAAIVPLADAMRDLPAALKRGDGKVLLAPSVLQGLRT